MQDISDLLVMPIQRSARRNTVVSSAILRRWSVLLPDAMAFSMQCAT